MLTINDFIEKQKEFDKKYSSKFNWDKKITEDNVDLLEYLIIALVGEFGEMANHLKKVLRGDKKLEEIRSELSEEVIDVFIYVLKIIYQLDIDLEQVYKDKMRKNEIRFQKFSKCEIVEND